VLHVDVEDTLEQPRPADAMRPDLGRLDLALGGRIGFGGRLLSIRWPLRHHQRAQLGVRRQHAVVREAGGPLVSRSEVTRTPN
jgi:hypothetical protein